MEYKIERWDVILNEGRRFPVIYIKPDLPLIEYLRKANFMSPVVIYGTGMIYDGNKMGGIVNQSGLVPNCRPNFYAETGWLVVQLISSWWGYPAYGKLGKVVFLTGA